MAGPTRVLAHEIRALGGDQPVVEVERARDGLGGSDGSTYLMVDGRAAFELSWWCGTCPFLFERQYGANETLSVDDLSEVLNDGLEGFDDQVVGSFGDFLERGEYVLLLLEVEPALVHPYGEGDYFTNEQLATWGLDPFWGLPQFPKTPYYRTDTRVLEGTDRFFEFVVPMVPPSWNDRSRVEEHAERLAQSSTPTCVALGLLDIRQRAMAETPEEHERHICLTHYLLDGHHKMEAAAHDGRRLRLLSLVSLDMSLTERSRVEAVVELYDEASAWPHDQ